MRVYPLLRSLLFRLPPERTHYLTLRTLSVLERSSVLTAGMRRIFAAPARPVEVFGLRFPNPLGLAAGYDKDGLAMHALAALGFGHLEIGTVTPRPQPGNPRPRLFRLPEEQAIINRLGFPSQGAAALARRLENRPSDVVLGVNIGKNKTTPNEEAVQDYLSLLETFIPVADYITVNISSPNTVGLRDLQHRAMLEDLLGQLARRRAQFFPETIRLSGGRVIPGGEIPILVKLSPDLTLPQLDEALEAIVRSGMNGVILTNTTIARPGVAQHRLAGEAGGLSGAPLRALSLAALRHALRVLDGRLPVVSVGGVMTPEEVCRRLDMGAALVQVYTGLVYYGPSLPRDSLRRRWRDAE